MLHEVSNLVQFLIQALFMKTSCALSVVKERGSEKRREKQISSEWGERLTPNTL